MWVDGEPVESPGELLSASELLSAELDQFGRNRGLRGCGSRRRLPAPVTRHGDPSSSSAAAVRLARPDPNVVIRPLGVSATCGRVADIDHDPARVGSEDCGRSVLLPRVTVDVADDDHGPATGACPNGGERLVDPGLGGVDRDDVGPQLAEDRREIV